MLCTAYDVAPFPYVDPSFRPSNAGIVSKRLNVGSHKQRLVIAQELQFSDATPIPQSTNVLTIMIKLPAIFSNYFTRNYMFHSYNTRTKDSLHEYMCQFYRPEINKIQRQYLMEYSI